MTQEEQVKELIWNVHVFSGMVEAMDIHAQSLRGVFRQRQKQKFNVMQNSLNAMLSELKMGSSIVDENMDNLGGEILDAVYAKVRPDFEALEAIKKL